MSEPAAPPEPSQAGPEAMPASGNGVHEPPVPPSEDRPRAEPEAPAAEEQHSPDASSHFMSAEQRPEPVEDTFKAAAPTPQADDAKLVALEGRVRRLEDVLASLQLMEPAARNRPAGQASAANDTHVKTAEQVLGVKSSQPPSAMGILPPMPTITRRQPWLLHDIYADLRAILRMFVDPRYRLMWQTKLFLPIVIAAMLFSWFVISAIPVIGPLTDRGLQLVMAFVLYKVLIREATHYRETSPDLPPSLRL